jgi:hypothetical protein
MGKVTNDKCTGFLDTKFTDFQQVYLLVHTSEVKLKDWQRNKVEMMEKT